MSAKEIRRADEIMRASENLAKEKSPAGAYAFGIVIEAKMSTMVSMAESRGYTKEQFVGFAERMWDKYSIGAGKGMPKK